MNKTFLKLLLIVIFITGCASVPKHLYKGKDAVVLYGNNPNIFEAQIGQLFTSITINDTNNNKTIHVSGSAPVYLKPGVHTIIVNARPSSLFAPLSARKTITVDLKANKKYKISAESFVVKGMVIFSLIDITEPKEQLLRVFKSIGYL